MDNPIGANYHPGGWIGRWRCLLDGRKGRGQRRLQRGFDFGSRPVRVFILELGAQDFQPQRGKPR
jgi:hypothetical protein